MIVCKRVPSNYGDFLLTLLDLRILVKLLFLTSICHRDSEIYSGFTDQATALGYGGLGRKTGTLQRVDVQIVSELCL